MREINFDITNVETTTDGNKIYIVVDWVGDESKVDNLFIDLLCEQKNDFAFFLSW